MLNLLKNIINKNSIIILLLIPILIIIINSNFLFPIITSAIMSYFLYNIKELLENIGINKKISFFFTYIFFLTIFFSIIFIILPILFEQLLIFFNNLPIMIQKVKILSYNLLNKYNFIVPKEQTNIIFSNIISYFQTISKSIINVSIISITLVIKWILYIALIPIFVFFFLKDYLKIKMWFNNIIPQNSEILDNILKEINIKITSYIRGKFIEIMIIIITNYLLFNFYKLSYSDLLSFLVGISVIIPYVGIIIISIPIIFISIVQFGLSNDFLTLNLIYLIIHFIDGYLLVPILFSETSDLHPIIIMFSIIIFGYIFNIYGIFFSIPLAITIKTIIKYT